MEKNKTSAARIEITPIRDVFCELADVDVSFELGENVGDAVGQILRQT